MTYAGLPSGMTLTALFRELPDLYRQANEADRRELIQIIFGNTQPNAETICARFEDFLEHLKTIDEISVAEELALTMALLLVHADDSTVEHQTVVRQYREFLTQRTGRVSSLPLSARNLDPDEYAGLLRDFIARYAAGRVSPPVASSDPQENVPHRS